ncbi:MAG: hypothetical protein LBE62_10060 [Azonexus sp.]|jgi:hypothetical protein|nr:hypothetical protein [Azonexus sp.]
MKLRSIVHFSLLLGIASGIMSGIFTSQHEGFIAIKFCVISYILLSAAAIVGLLMLQPEWEDPVFEYKPCPKCSSLKVEKVGFTWWLGILPSLLNQVKCKECGASYNGKTGKSNTGAIIIYVTGAGIAIISLLLTSSRWKISGYLLFNW